jgi:predicted nucleotidyltransferase
MQKLIQSIAGLLDKYNVSYMVIGGQAVLVYGEPRLTKDIDIVLGADLTQLNILKEICDELNLKLIEPFNEEKIKQTMVYPVIDNGSGLRVDFIFSFTEFEKNAISRAVNIEVGRKKIKYSAIEDLIIFKIFSGRPVDLEDVKNIILKNPGYNINYVVDWLKKFDEGSKILFTEIFRNIIKNI